ncbi:MAG: hypothetical protein N4A33_09790 [Bacteriovoracaceae bacterium]|jgi:tetratricopeptide (TPR) repeat protein|nr:hypothetical protein [Bacteriovoracaceae bacterium]
MNNKSNLLVKYKYLYEKNPRSKVFAPLAQIYRKLGMVDEALSILREGIKFHPDYVYAYITLGQLYLDSREYDLAYSTVKPFVKNNLENIVLQEVYAKICLELDKDEEALETYKLLLMLNPKDKNFKEMVINLEDKHLLNPVRENKKEDIFEDLFSSEDDWVQVDFNNSKAPVDDIQNWEATKSYEQSVFNSFKEQINNNVEVEQEDLNSNFYIEDYDNAADEVIEPTDDGFAPLELKEEKTSLTLVELYMAQGHNDKAKELLEKNISIDENDDNSINLLKKLNTSSNKDNILERKLDLFLEKIQNTAHENLNN